MRELAQLVELTKAVAAETGARFLDSVVRNDKSYVHCSDNPREIKALADVLLEKSILRSLAPARLPILSEESGLIPGEEESKYWFIVDPLDGTFNFVKGLGPSAVSIALWERQKPIFGAVYSLRERQLFCGGAGMGSYGSGRKIAVSGTRSEAQASICTGFPARFDVTDDKAMIDLCRTLKRYAKVRMLGSAAVSLLHVADGSADAYLERNIMLWDVAAGLAIVEGAGGRVDFAAGTGKYSLDVYAHNGILSGPH